MQALLKLKVAAIFSAPVSEEEVPGYSLVIQNPMDLGTVLEKLRNEEYASAGTVHCLTQLAVGLQLHDDSNTAIEYIHTYVYINTQINRNVTVVRTYDAVAKALAITLLRDIVLLTIVPVNVCHAGTRPKSNLLFIWQSYCSQIRHCVCICMALLQLVL